MKRSSLVFWLILLCDRWFLQLKTWFDATMTLCNNTDTTRLSTLTCVCSPCPPCSGWCPPCCPPWPCPPGQSPRSPSLCPPGPRGWSAAPATDLELVLQYHWNQIHSKVEEKISEDSHLELCPLDVEYEPVHGGAAQGGQQGVQGQTLLQHRGGRLLRHQPRHRLHLATLSCSAWKKFHPKVLNHGEGPY